MSEEPRRIINTYDQLMAAVASGLLPKKHALAISPANVGIRTAYISGVRVWSPFKKIDPTAHWSDHGAKHIRPRNLTAPHAERQRTAVEDAVSWIRTTYGYDGPWVGNAMRDKVPEIVQKTFPIRRAR